MHWVDVIYVGGSIRLEFFEKEQQRDSVIVLESQFSMTPRSMMASDIDGHIVVLDLKEAVGYAYST